MCESCNKRDVSLTTKNNNGWTYDVLDYLAGNISRTLKAMSTDILVNLEEIRLRQGKPLMVSYKNVTKMITSSGRITESAGQAYMINRVDIDKTLEIMTESSIYAVDEELKNGFLTLKGGCRVGVCGRAVLASGHVKTLKHINGFNIRVAREVRGAADRVINAIIKPPSQVYNTLIISPPRCGKTTLLRDIIRQISTGKSGFQGLNVGVVDERSEVAACFMGVPQNDIGIRSDVLDACPKAEGIIMLIRSMGPHIIATDEIGKQEDIKAIEEAILAGVKIITTVHGKDVEDIIDRPILSNLINKKFFERLIVLDNSSGVGTVQGVYDGNTLLPLRNRVIHK